jgi:hypothetical protein
LEGLNRGFTKPPSRRLLFKYGDPPNLSLSIHKQRENHDPFNIRPQGNRRIDQVFTDIPFGKNRNLGNLVLRKVFPIPGLGLNRLRRRFIGQGFNHYLVFGDLIGFYHSFSDGLSDLLQRRRRRRKGRWENWRGRNLFLDVHQFHDIGLRFTGFSCGFQAEN